MNFLKHIRNISKDIDNIENKLQKHLENEEILKMLSISKSLVYFSTSLKSNEAVMERLLRGRIMRLFEEDEDILEDAIIENKQAIEMVDMHRTILESMMDGFASVINNNVNQVMKFLAAITIILSIPTMLASFWGMNVGLPLSGDKFGFWYIVSASVVLTALVILFFRKKKMF